MNNTQQLLQTAGLALSPMGAASVVMHATPDFVEHPGNVLLAARLAALLHPDGAVIAAGTMDLMRSMVKAGRLAELPPATIWAELSLALADPGGDEAGYKPSWYFKTLHECGALAALLPELAALDGVPQRAEYHPEVDTLVHTLMCVDQAVLHGYGLEVRAAALLHDLGKGITPKSELPRHHQHEERGVPLVEAVCDRLQAPVRIRDLAVAVTRDHLNVHRAEELGYDKLHDLLGRLQAFDDAEFFSLALATCLCDARGRLGLEDRPYPFADRLRLARSVALTVGDAGDDLRRRRIDHLRVVMPPRQLNTHLKSAAK